jgi:ribosome-associated translation inhibitor RaiA
LRIAVRSTGLVLTDAVKVDVRRRVLLAMSRFGQEIKDVAVRLAESRNPLGGVDRRCRLQARLGSGPVLRAEAVNGELETAVGRSASRLARLVTVELDGGDGRTPPPTGGRRRESDE